MTHDLPNTSLREQELQSRLTALGIDYDLFVRLIEARIPVTNMRMFFKKPDSSLYARPTIARWVRVYKEHQTKDKE